MRHLRAWLDRLKQESLIEGYRLLRRKLGFGPRELGEFQITIEVRDLAQLDQAFLRVVPRSGEIERLHQQVYSRVCDFQSALYRDFPDPGRTES